MVDQAKERGDETEQHVQVELACKENPFSLELARSAAYMYYHAGHRYATNAAEHFDRMDKISGFSKGKSPKSLQGSDHGGMIDIFARLDRTEDARAHCQAMVKRILKHGRSLGEEMGYNDQQTNAYIKSIATHCLVLEFRVGNTTQKFTEERQMFRKITKKFKKVRLSSVPLALCHG